MSLENRTSFPNESSRQAEVPSLIRLSRRSRSPHRRRRHFQRQISSDPNSLIAQVIADFNHG